MYGYGFGWPAVSYAGRSERDIYDIFAGFTKEVNDRKRNMYQEIDSWREAQHRQIEEHASKQRSLLDQECQKQLDGIPEVRQQFIEAVRRHELKGDKQQIDQLLSDCKAFKSELGAIEFNESPVLFIRFMTDEQIKQEKRNEQKKERIDDNKFRSNSGAGYDNYAAGNIGAHGGTPSKQISAAFKQGNHQSSTAIDASTNYANSNSNTRNDGDPMPKCPTCYMIFPSYMTLAARKQHVDEHFKNTS